MFNKEKAKAYYLKEFKKIDEGKISWNWCAAMFGCYWFIYRKVYSCVLYSLGVALTLLGLVLATVVDVTSPDVACAVLIYYTSISILSGFFANRLYYSVVKSKIKIGAHLYKDYQPTSLASLITMIIIPFLIQILIQILNHLCNSDVNPSVLTASFWCAAVYVVWKTEEDAIEKNAENLGEFSTEINEENISKLL